MAQRGIRIRDAELIALIGTEVEDGYLVHAKEYWAIEREIRGLLGRLRRLVGKRLIVADGRIVTAFHVSRRQERRLMRQAREHNLRD
jgi:hypothetical protein